MRPLVCALLAALGAAAAGALEITNVYHEPAVVPAPGEEVVVHFRLSEPARVALEIYDGRDIRIRRVEAGEPLEAGDHTLRWHGEDFAGRPVPPEAYTYAIEAVEQAGGDPVRWDLAPGTGGEAVPVESLTWDATAGAVRYRVSAPARVRIRAGLANDGPLLRTLVDWPPRAPGAHTEPWDGRDVSGHIDLSEHPQLALVGEAFALPRNTVLVTAAPSRVALIEDVPEPTVRRKEERKRRRRMFDYPSQDIAVRQDYPLRLEIVGAPRETEGGAAIVRGPVPIRLSVDPAQRAAILAERAEAVFFVDGRIAFENEVSFLPITWTWDPEGVQGVHYITANLRGYEGHFGMQTLKLRVEPAASSEP